MTIGFSVFIPCWNDTRWLPGAIDSLLAQTHPDWEVVIGDNASAEDVEAVVRRYADPRVRYHRWDTHLEFAGNANRTLRLGRLDWLQFLSADDRLEPGCLAAMAACIETAEAAGQSLAMVVTGCGRYDPDGRPIEDQPFFGTWRLKPLEGGIHGPVAWLRHCAGPGATPWNIGSMAMPRTTLDIMGGYFREEVGMAVDVELAARVAAYGPVGYVAEPLLHYTVRLDSITYDLDTRNLDGAERLPPVAAATMSALAVHEHHRRVAPEERRYLDDQVADRLIGRALRHRFREGGRGRRAAAADLWRARRYGLRWLVSPRQLARASAALVAPRSLLVRMFKAFRRRGIYP